MALPFEGFYTKAQLTRWLTAMPKRFSCRKFSGSADVSQLSALTYTAQRVNLPGIRIAVVPKGAQDLVVPLPLFPRFENLTQYAVIFAKKDRLDAALLAGISGEAFNLELVSQGLQGCWITGNYRRMTAMEHAQTDEQVMAVMPFGLPQNKDGASVIKRKILTAFSPADPTLWPYWAYRAAEAMRSAPSAMNRQPWKVSYTGSTLCFTGNKLNSIDSGIAVLHIESALAGYQRGWRLSTDKKSLLVKVTDSDEPV